jgi:beta-glucanase (GH16 family)
MKSFLFFLIIFSFLVSCSKESSSDGPSEELAEPEWQLVWADEFDVNGLPNPQKWNYEVGGHGYGNNELQYYTNQRSQNVRVKDGLLTIEAHRESYYENEYTSAKLTSKGKGEWRYGRIEVKAKLPKGRGTWPAIWMMPEQSQYGSGGWPDNGEIDIMEHVGFDEGQVHCTIHCAAYNHRINTQVGKSILLPDATQQFHIYSIEWWENKIEGFVDDEKYFSFANQNKDWQTWPFDKPFYLILNLAIGGDWGGAQGVDNTIFPEQFTIDYVRVYEWK